MCVHVCTRRYPANSYWWLGEVKYNHQVIGTFTYSAFIRCSRTKVGVTKVIIICTIHYCSLIFEHYVSCSGFVIWRIVNKLWILLDRNCAGHMFSLSS